MKWQIHLTTMLYANDHEEHLTSWSLFFESNSVPPRCPCATGRLSPIEYGAVILKTADGLYSKATKPTK